MNRIAALLGAAALGVVLAGSAWAADQIRIVMVTHGQAASGFWSVAKKGADDADKDYADTTVEYRSPETYDMVSMAQLIDAAVANKPTASSSRSPTRTRSARRSRRRSPPASRSSRSTPAATSSKSLGIMAHVGQTEFQAGLGAGERLRRRASRTPPASTRKSATSALDLRCNGFFQGLADPKPGKILTGKISDPAGMQATIAAALMSDPTIEALF